MCFKNQERSVLQKDAFSDFSWKRWDGELWTVVGREFLILAAWKWKDPFPADLRLVLGTFNSFSLLDRRVREGWYVWSSSERYGGESSQSAWKLVWQFCSGYGPQQGASVFFFPRRGVTWSDFRLRRTRLAALFWTFCRRFSEDDGRPESVELQ